MKMFEKWVSAYGNAVSINENRPEGYGKNITLRYTVKCPFEGDAIRLTFDNFCGSEAVKLEKVTIIKNNQIKIITFNGINQVEINPKKAVISDEISLDIAANDDIKVSFYLKDYTQLRSAVYISGPYTKGEYAVGDLTEEEEFPIEISRKTNIHYFLSDVSVRTADKNSCIICYGDSITAQDWPDYLLREYIENGRNDLAIVRKATSGSRILREYSCITYESYGLKGKNRFEHEISSVNGADAIIIQQGINDIIHPVGTEINLFRPMSDLPKVEELIEGLKWYISKSREYGLKVYVGTLLPIKGWRTDAPFREEMRNAYNDWIRNTDLIDGCIDFDGEVNNPAEKSGFLPEYDSGDHLHPSAKGYEKMGKTAFKTLE